MIQFLEKAENANMSPKTYKVQPFAERIKPSLIQSYLESEKTVMKDGVWLVSMAIVIL